MTQDNAHTLLVNIGVSPAASTCYLFLAQRLPEHCQAQAIFKETGLSKTSAYRALNELTAKGFVQTSRIVKATRYWAIPLTHALDSYAEYQRATVKPIMWAQRDQEAIA